MLRRLLWGRPRRRAGLSLALLFFGAFSCFGATATIVLGAPASWFRAREVAALPQPQPAELPGLAPGTAMLVQAQLPPDAPTSTPHGLALFAVEERTRRAPTRQTGEERSPNSGSGSWERVTPPPATVALQLSNAEMLDVQLSPDISLLNGQEIAGETTPQADGSERQRRYVGYLPGRTLTLEGTWEGDNRFTAQVSYAGTPADYVEYRANQPGMMLLYGVLCCLVSLVLLGVGGVLRLAGR
jgi:hypothetical protein